MTSHAPPDRSQPAPLKIQFPTSYYAGRNLVAEPVRLRSGSSNTLGYLRPANYQFVAANHTLGINGTF